MMGSHLDIDFLPIFFDLGCQNGGKLGGKIEPRAAMWAHLTPKGA